MGATGYAPLTVPHSRHLGAFPLPAVHELHAAGDATDARASVRAASMLRNAIGARLPRTAARGAGDAMILVGDGSSSVTLVVGRSSGALILRSKHMSGARAGSCFITLSKSLKIMSSVVELSRDRVEGARWAMTEAD